MTVGDRIRLRRKELNLSQEELAKRAGYSYKAVICKLESASDDISQKQLNRLAEALDVNTAFLLGYKKTKVEMLDTYYHNIQYLSYKIGYQMFKYFKGRREFPVEELIAEFDVWQEEMEALKVLYNAYLKIKEREDGTKD